MVPRYKCAAILVWPILSAPLGCGNQDAQQLQSKVTELERELASMKTQLEEKGRLVAELRVKQEQSEANADDLTTALVRVKVERDKLKQELMALRKKTR
jgi:septal ring factor EnvC (AmiA/AmiB activator)